MRDQPDVTEIQAGNNARMVQRVDVPAELLRTGAGVVHQIPSAGVGLIHILHADPDSGTQGSREQLAVERHVPPEQLLLMPGVNTVVDRVNDTDIRTKDTGDFQRPPDTREDDLPVCRIVAPEPADGKAERRVRLIDAEPRRVCRGTDPPGVLPPVRTVEGTVVLHHAVQTVVERVKARVPDQSD